MSKKLPTGISSRQHQSGGKSVIQYRARVQDPSRRLANGRVANKSSAWFDRLSDARNWMDEQRQTVAKFGSLKVDRRLTVGDACDQFITISRKAGINGRRPIEDATWQRYKSTIDNVIAGTLDLMKVSDLRPMMVGAWAQQVAEDRGRDAAHRALAFVKMVLEWCVTQEFVLSNPAKSINISKHGADDDDVDGKTVTEFMSTSDVKAMLASADSLAAGGVTLDKTRGAGAYQAKQQAKAWARWRPLCYLLVSTGVRIGEACALQWKNVDLDRGVIFVAMARKRNGSVGTPKTRAGTRYVTIGKETVEILRAWKAVSNPGPNGYVFGSGAPLSPSLFARAWKKLMTLAGLLDADGNALWSRHDCRHYHASVLIMAGKPTLQVADRLGHADVNVTQKVYAHLFRELSGHGNTTGADLEHLILARA